MEENPNGINDIVGHNLCEKLLNIEREGLRWELHERTNMWRIFEHGTELVGKKKAHFYYEPKTGLIESISRYIDSNSYLRGSMQIGYRLLDIFNENRHIKSDLEIDLMELQLDDKTQPEARRNIEKSTESINLVMGKSHQNNNYKGETK